MEIIQSKLNLIKKIIFINVGLIGFTYSIPSLADPAPITINGTTYDIKFEDVTYSNISFVKENQPWWGDADLAKTFAGLTASVSDQYLPNANVSCCGGFLGPSFIYNVTDTSVQIAYGRRSDGAAFLFNNGMDWNRSYAYVDSVTPLHEESVQPYAAMQNVGLKSIDNNRDLVLAKAGECNNYGWVIGDTDYCVFTNAKNKVSYVNGDTTRGSYGSAVFNGSINVEKTINDKWKAGVAYGMGSANLYDFDFSGTTANLDSSNNHYSVYGVKKVNDKFTLKGMIGGSVFDYKGKRNYLTTSATSAYETDGYTAEINGIWDIKKDIKNSKTPIRLQPTVGVAFAAHAQDGFSESGSGDLITVESNQAESLLFKTGIGIDKQILMEGGKWLLVPSLALNYEMDTYADDNHRGVKGGVTGSSDATTLVSAKTFGQHRGSVKVGADFVLTKDFMFNLNAEYGLATYGDENSYGGGFRWQF